MFVRPTNAPPLPRTIALEWVDGEGRAHVTDVSLSAALRSAGGAPNEAIVFEFGPSDDIRVSIETVSR